MTYEKMRKTQMCLGGGRKKNKRNMTTIIVQTRIYYNNLK